MIRAVALILNGVFLQMLELIGLIGLATAAVAGFMRGPRWTIPLIAAGFTVIDANLPTLQISWLDKAASSSERIAYLFIVFLVISMLGYLIGRYGRRLWGR
ncbi:MAG: hypothetical protein N2444_01085 [Methylocystis sp.]|nr:hypothetical protein [Methylocystis sp.]